LKQNFVLIFRNIRKNFDAPPGVVFGLEKPFWKRDQIYVQYLEDCDQKMDAKIYNAKVRVFGGCRA
jgi:hypothetical protein